MALTETQNGSQAATLDTEHTLGSEETVDAYYQLLVDASAMVNGDVLVLRGKVKVASGGTARIVMRATFRDVLEQDHLLSIPVPNIYGLIFTLEQTDGTGRTFPWSILRAA